MKEFYPLEPFFPESPRESQKPSSHSKRSDESKLSNLPDPCKSAQLAVALGKSPMTLVDWCQEREFTHIPCFRLGNRWYIRLPELIRWLKGFEVGQIDFHRRPRNTKRRAASKCGGQR